MHRPLLVEPPMCTLKELDDGTYSIQDLELMNELLDLKIAIAEKFGVGGDDLWFKKILPALRCYELVKERMRIIIEEKDDFLNKFKKRTAECGKWVCLGCRMIHYFCTQAFVSFCYYYIYIH